MSRDARHSVLERLESALNDLRGWLDPEQPPIEELPHDWVGALATWLAVWNHDTAEEFQRLTRAYDGDAGVGDVFDFLHHQFGILSAEIEIDAEPHTSDELAPTVKSSDKIFIGHGHSAVWKDLRDFLERRLHLSCDEFEAVATAGIPHAERLGEMLDNAAFAFLVLTGEDQVGDERLAARANVIHEVGLFQGRLGFRRAIVLLEEGCQEFSNIAGLGQIRFPRGDVIAKSEEIRRVLEREGLVTPSGARESQSASHAASLHVDFYRETFHIKNTGDAPATRVMLDFPSHKDVPPIEDPELLPLPSVQPDQTARVRAFVTTESPPPYDVVVTWKNPDGSEGWREFHFPS